jgi:hypothetical protein
MMMSFAARARGLLRPARALPHFSSRPTATRGPLLRTRCGTTTMDIATCSLTCSLAFPTRPSALHPKKTGEVGGFFSSYDVLRAAELGLSLRFSARDRVRLHDVPHTRFLVRAVPESLGDTRQDAYPCNSHGQEKDGTVRIVQRPSPFSVTKELLLPILCPGVGCLFHSLEVGFYYAVVGSITSAADGVVRFAAGSFGPPPVRVCRSAPMESCQQAAPVGLPGGRRSLHPTALGLCSTSLWGLSAKYV